MDKHMTDSELIAILSREPERGFKLLVEAYGGIVKAVCANTLSGFSREDIEEAVADSFIGLWQSRGKTAGVESLKGYLIGIARRCAADKMRSVMKIAPAHPLDFDVDADMTDEIARRTNIEIVKKTIASMPPFEREVFVRRYYLYERIKSIARNMGCSEKKVENILHRYKKKLKTELIKGGISI
ncbi:MAG: RNA polymerase sigma factor [Oscillospiraceae bacterium]|nr:RNA polymerase sigma factor [Oscillospiraceae bacterium]